MRKIRIVDDEEKGYDFRHAYNDPLWDSEEVRKLLKKRAKKSREEILAAKRAHAKTVYDWKKAAYNDMVLQNHVDLETGRITQAEADARLAPLKYGYHCTKDKISMLQARLNEALNAGDEAGARIAEKRLSQQQQWLQQYTVSLFEDICKVLYSTYGNPGNINAWNIPKFNRAEDFPQLLAMSLPISKWNMVTDNLLDTYVIRTARANLDSDNKGTLVDVEEQMVLSTDFNAAVAYMEEWWETATDGEKDELIALWRNVTQEIRSQFLATFQNINLYWFRAVLV